MEPRDHVANKIFGGLGPAMVCVLICLVTSCMISAGDWKASFHGRILISQVRELGFDVRSVELVLHGVNPHPSLDSLVFSGLNTLSQSLQVIVQGLKLLSKRHRERIGLTKGWGHAWRGRQMWLRYHDRVGCLRHGIESWRWLSKGVELC